MDGVDVADGEPAAEGGADAEDAGQDAGDAEVAQRREVVLGEADPVAQHAGQQQTQAVAVDPSELQLRVRGAAAAAADAADAGQRRLGVAVDVVVVDVDVGSTVHYTSLDPGSPSCRQRAFDTLDIDP